MEWTRLRRDWNSRGRYQAKNRNIPLCTGFRLRLPDHGSPQQQGKTGVHAHELVRGRVRHETCLRTLWHRISLAEVDNSHRSLILKTFRPDQCLQSPRGCLPPACQPHLRECGAQAPGVHPRRPLPRSIRPHPRACGEVSAPTGPEKGAVR